MQGFSRLTWAATPAFTIWRLWWRPGGTDCLLFLMICPTGAASSCGASTTTKVRHKRPQIQYCLSNLSTERHTFRSTCMHFMQVVWILQGDTLMQTHSDCWFGFYQFHKVLFSKKATMFRTPSGSLYISKCQLATAISPSLSLQDIVHTHTLWHTHIFTLLSVQLSPAVTLKPFREAATAKCDVSSNLSSNSHSEALQ